VTALTLLVAAAAFTVVWLDDSGWTLVAELLALTALLAACLVWTLRSGVRDFNWLGAAATVIVVFGGYQFYRQTTVFPEVKVAVKTLLGRGDNRYTTHPLAGYVSASDSILSEDGSIPVLLGQRPVVLDQFAFDRLIRTHPDWGRKLAARVAAGDFDKIVLGDPIERQGEHLGPDVTAAIEQHYRQEAAVTTPASGSYWIYVPK
jgi:hypothetical protein